MALKKCPLCGSRLLGGTCNECGYSVPDETEISSMYNYDPDDDEFGDKDDFAVPEADGMPQVREEVERNFRNPYDYKRAPKIETVQKSNAQIQPQQNNANPYANFSPVNNHQKTPVQNTFNNKTSHTASMDPYFIRDVVAGVVLSMVFSLLGIFYGIKIIKKYPASKDNKYLYAGIAVLVLSIIGFIF
ncbi:MAG: hypothetical protein IJ007_06330 [Oscillospiraceae bacterium]|nr:hypothetical protein [Oscillospiraceae bacterium]